MAAGALTLMLLAAPAHAQDEGPITITTRQRYDTLQLTSIETALRFEYRFDSDRIKRSDGTEQRETEHRFREIFELDTEGFAGHPNLFAFQFSGEFWLSQVESDISGMGPDNSSNDILLNYTASGTFLQQSDTPITIYGQQTVNDLERQFGGSLFSIVSEYGARVDLRHDEFPTRIEAFRREQTQEDTFGNTEFTIDQYTIRADGRGAYAENQQLWWDVSYDTVDESGDLRPTQDYDRFEANATHTINFGDTHQHQLRSTGRVYMETGDRDFNQYRISERLRFEHSESLTSRLEYTGELIERSMFEQQRHEFTGLAQHQLWESLLTTARAGYRMQDVPTDDFNSDELFGELSLDYTKRVPYGTFLAGVDFVGSDLNETPRGASIPLFDQQFTFDASGLVVINRRNVDPDSIVVRDLSGLIIYVENIDYTVTSFPSRTEVRRVLGGDIAAGQTVLIDFTILPQPGGETTTLGVGLEFRYRLEEGPLRGLSVYTRIFDQDEQRSIAFFEGEEFPENDFTVIVYGIEYSRDRLYGRAEYEVRDSSFDPFNAWRLEARYAHPFGPDSRVILNALYQAQDRTDTGLETETLTLSGQLSQRLGRNLNGSILVLFQDEQASFGSDTQGYEQELRVRWRYGQTDLVVRFRNTIRDSTLEERMFQTLFIGMRREF